jgi:hypothetical protein
LTTWEACGCAVRVRSDKRGHAVQMRRGNRWESVQDGAGRVCWYRSPQEANEQARMFLNDLVWQAFRLVQEEAWTARSRAKRESAREACSAAYEWLARHPRGGWS